MSSAADPTGTLRGSSGIRHPQRFPVFDARLDHERPYALNVSRVAGVVAAAPAGIRERREAVWRKTGADIGLAKCALVIAAIEEGVVAPARAPMRGRASCGRPRTSLTHWRRRRDRGRYVNRLAGSRDGRPALRTCTIARSLPPLPLTIAPASALDSAEFSLLGAPSSRLAVTDCLCDSTRAAANNGGNRPRA